MGQMITDRRQFLSGSGALAASLSLKFGIESASAQDDSGQAYDAWEDLMREKWTWACDHPKELRVRGCLAELAGRAPSHQRFLGK